MLPALEQDKPLFEQMMQYYMTQRKTLLEQVDAIERLLNISPRTAELRKAAKDLYPVVKFDAEKKEGKE